MYSYFYLFSDVEGGWYRFLILSMRLCKKAMDQAVINSPINFVPVGPINHNTDFNIRADGLWRNERKYVLLLCRKRRMECQDGG